MLFALKMGSYSALKKREALINIVMIYLVVVSNLVMTETLIREVIEETGYTLSSYSNPRIYDMMVFKEVEDDCFKRVGS